MGYVTSEQISRARQYDVLNYVLTYESNNVKRVGSGYRLKDHESLAISEKGFYWHSREIGGKTALDFLTFVRGYGLVEAVCMLIGEKPYERGDKPPTVTERNQRSVAAFSQSENREESITPKARPPTPLAGAKYVRPAGG